MMPINSALEKGLYPISDLVFSVIFEYTSLCRAALPHGESFGFLLCFFEENMILKIRGFLTHILKNTGAFNALNNSGWALTNIVTLNLYLIIQEKNLSFRPSIYTARRQNKLEWLDLVVYCQRATR